MRRRLTKKEREQIYEKCNGHCAYCGCDLDYKDMQVDHVIPLRKGGADELNNMLPACGSCNHYKTTFTAEEFRKYLEGIPERLMRDSIPFKVGMRFGIIQKKSDPVRFYFEQKTEDRIEKQGWIPISERVPENDNYILLSFKNFPIPAIGRYQEDDQGGAFYLGDCDEEDTCVSQNLFVNAWMPLPAPYRPERSEEW